MPDWIWPIAGIVAVLSLFFCAHWLERLTKEVTRLNAILSDLVEVIRERPWR